MDGSAKSGPSGSMVVTVPSSAEVTTIVPDWLTARAASSPASAIASVCMSIALMTGLPSSAS